jgi:hypothetical protein
MNPVCRERCAILRLHDIHCGMRPKQFDEHALMAGIEMLHQHKGHAGVRGHVVEEASKGGKPAGRCANAYNE